MIRFYPSQRRLLLLAWPLLLQALLSALLPFVDGVMVGQLGEAVISGLGNAAQLLLFSQLLLAAFNMGGAVVLAQRYGGGDPQAMANALTTLLYCGALAALVLSIGLWLGSDWLLSWLTLEALAGGEVTPIAASYLQLVVLSVPLHFVGMLMAVAMQASGDTRTPMLVAVMVNIANIVGNWLLIFGGALPGTEPLFPPLGFIGAAYATLFCQLGGGAALLWLGLAKRWRWSGRLGRFERASLSQLLRVGAPMSVDGFYWQGARLFYTLLMNSIGAFAMAGYVILRLIKGLMLIPANALQSATSILIGQQLGASKFNAARLQVRRSIQLMLVVMALPALLLLLFNQALLDLYQLSPTTREQLRICLYLLSLSLFATAFNAVIPGALRAGGDSKAVMHITLLSFALVGAPMTWLFGITLQWGLIGAFVGICVEEFAKAGMLIYRLRQGRWLRRLESRA